MLTTTSENICNTPKPPYSFPKVVSFDFGWKHHLGSLANAHPEAPDFDDASWGEVNVPHDALIHQLPSPHAHGVVRDEERGMAGSVKETPSNCPHTLEKL